MVVGFEFSVDFDCCALAASMVFGFGWIDELMLVLGG